MKFHALWKIPEKFMGVLNLRITHDIFPPPRIGHDACRDVRRSTCWNMEWHGTCRRMEWHGSCFVRVRSFFLCVAWGVRNFLT